MKRGMVLQIIALTLLATNFALAQTSWQRHAGNPVLNVTQSWESGFGVIGPRVLKIGNVYKMWYTGLGANRQIGLATSTDGIAWTKAASNPVLSHGQLGSFDADHVDYPSVIYHNNKYWMWYTGWSGGVRQIGLATSLDGANWTKHAGNPVLISGSSGQWDAVDVRTPTVLYDGQIFKMWYIGSNSAGELATGYAISLDGIHWEKYGANPVLKAQPNSWENQTAAINTVLFQNGLYHAWYGGNNQMPIKVGYVFSSDGVHWTRHLNNPVLVNGANNAWDGSSLGGLWVLFENNAFKMWYSGLSDLWRIGYATSQTTITPVSKRFVYIPRIYGLPGDTITVTLFADTVSTISGGDVTIRFDADILKALKMQSTKYTRDFLIVANLDTPGVAHVSLASARSAVGGPGGLFNIKMIVNSSLPVPPAPQPQSLQLTKVSFYTENGQAIPLTKRDGEFILGRTRGDVNRDGRINSADAILTLRIAAGLIIPTPDQLADADVDGNSRVESIDASCMLHQAVGLDCPPGGVSNMAANLFIAPFSISAGNEIETKISVTGLDKLLGGDVGLRFDSNALEITDIRPSPEMSNVVFVNNLSNNGQASFSFAAASGFQTQTLAVVRLRAKSQITEKSLRSNSAMLFDSQGKRWNGILTGIDETDAAKLPAQFRLEQNYPNPFYRQAAPALAAIGASPTQTQINYVLPQRARVKLMIYDLHGRLVRALEDAEKPAGRYAQIWDGADAFGAPVAAGIYLYRLEAGQQVLCRKLLLIE